MAELEVLVRNNKLYKIFGMSLSKDAKWLDIFFSLLANIIVIFFLLLSCWWSLLFIFATEENKEIVPLLCAFTQVIVFGPIMCSYMSIVWCKQNACNTIESIEWIVCQRLRWNDALWTIYKPTDQKSFLVAKWAIIILSLCYPGALTIAVIGSAMYHAVYRQFNVSNWPNCMIMLTPFDRSTLFGQLGYTFVEICSLFIYCSMYANLLSLFLSCNFFFESFCIDFQRIFDKIDRTTQTEDGEKARRQKSLLIEATKFQTSIYDIFKKFSSIVSGTIFFELLCGSAYIATSLFRFDKAIEGASLGYGLFNAASLPILSTSSVFPYCFFATRTLDKLSDNANAAYNSAWYCLPVEQQRAVQLMIVFSQRKREFRGFGIISCSLDVFVKIIKAAISYYLMITNLSKF